MAKTQTLNFPKGASFVIPFQFRLPGVDVTDWTGWRCHFVVKKDLGDPDNQAIIIRTIEADVETGYNELLLTADETNGYDVGSYWYQATVVDDNDMVGKSEIGMFIVEKTTLLSPASSHTDSHGAVTPPPEGGSFRYTATRPINLDINLVATNLPSNIYGGMAASVYLPSQEINGGMAASVYLSKEHVNGGVA